MCRLADDSERGIDQRRPVAYLAGELANDRCRHENTRQGSQQPIDADQELIRSGSDRCDRSKSAWRSRSSRVTDDSAHPGHKIRPSRVRDTRPTRDNQLGSAWAVPNSARGAFLLFFLYSVPIYFLFTSFVNSATTQLWDTGDRIPDISPRGYGGLAESRVV